MCKRNGKYESKIKPSLYGLTRIIRPRVLLSAYAIASITFGKVLENSQESRLGCCRKLKKAQLAEQVALLTKQLRQSQKSLASPGMASVPKAWHVQIENRNTPDAHRQSERAAGG